MGMTSGSCDFFADRGFMDWTKQTILITGAAGSIGSEIVRQLARFNSKKVILVDQAETPLLDRKSVV
jgi:FlaA1/EpsC-like NDP-sugar epimerase